MKVFDFITRIYKYNMSAVFTQKRKTQHFNIDELSLSTCKVSTTEPFLNSVSTKRYGEKCFFKSEISNGIIYYFQGADDRYSGTLKSAPPSGHLPYHYEHLLAAHPYAAAM